MKIYICYEFPDGPYGGGNQFLKALKEFFISNNLYEERIEDADVVLFNSFHIIDTVIKFKKAYPSKLFIHRLDGPVRLYNSMSDVRDHVANIANNLIADATIFQSAWSRQANYELGLKRSNRDTVIMNSPDPEIFNKSDKAEFGQNIKTKLIAASWSNNWKKGFRVYEWLDNNLDFGKYEMTFIGKSPVIFKNINSLEPMDSKNLAVELKKSDIFITASQKDPCSNSLIEAMHCGIPVIALNDGGHPEIVRKGGELFTRPEEIPDILRKIIGNYESYQKNIDLPGFDETGGKYLDYMLKIYSDFKNLEYVPKRLSSIDLLRLSGSMVFNKVKSKINYFF